MKLITATAIIAISLLAASGNATADPFVDFAHLIQNADKTRAIEIAQCAGVIDAFAIANAANKYGADVQNHPERFDEISEYSLGISFAVVAQLEYSGATGTDGQEVTRRVQVHAESSTDATINAIKNEDDAFLRRTTKKCVAHKGYVAAYQKVIDEMEAAEETTSNKIGGRMEVFVLMVLYSSGGDSDFMPSDVYTTMENCEYAGQKVVENWGDAITKFDCHKTWLLTDKKWRFRGDTPPEIYP